MKELLVLRDLECIKAIAHPRRIDILKSFEKRAAISETIVTNVR